ncbi:MAG: SdpI family protein [Oscillospiraceae bacterium]|nr:SdpI family protein [Oscillospiraceae bacterium]
MGFDSVTKFLDDFDISKLLPDLGSMLGKVDLVLRIGVLLAPLVILALGLLYFLTPAKEANHHFGYRFYWGMSSIDCWRFTQKLAGAVWSILGFVMLLVMALLCSSFKGMEAMAMVERAVKYLFAELIIIAVSCIAIDVVVMVFYDSKGVRRSQKPPKPQQLDEEYFDEGEFDEDFDNDEGPTNGYYYAD